MTRVSKVTGAFALERSIGRKHRHGGALDRLQKRLDPPIELVVADDPGVVTEQIEKFDHHPALVGKRELGALVDIADIDQERVRILGAPALNLRDAARHPPEIGAALVINRGQNMAVQIGGVEERNPDHVRICGGAQPTWHRTNRRRSAKQAKEFASIWRSNNHGPRF